MPQTSPHRADVPGQSTALSTRDCRERERAGKGSSQPATPGWAQSSDHTWLCSQAATQPQLLLVCTGVCTWITPVHSAHLCDSLRMMDTCITVCTCVYTCIIVCTYVYTCIIVCTSVYSPYTTVYLYQSVYSAVYYNLCTNVHLCYNLCTMHTCMTVPARCTPV